MEFDPPRTQYALSNDVSIAYQVAGDGPIDLVMVPGIVSHVEFMHELPGYTNVIQRLSKFARVVALDKRGQGLSDRVTGAVSLEQRMDDVRAVMDAANVSRAAIMGFSEGCVMSALFAATYPDRTSRLLLFGGYSIFPRADVENLAAGRAKIWGSGNVLKIAYPSLASTPHGLELVAKLERFSGSPGSIKAMTLLNGQIDVRAILPAVQVPTLVMHRSGDRQVPIESGRRLAELLGNARFVEYPGEDHVFWTGDVDSFIGDVQEFVTGSRETSLQDIERVLATVLFTDIVDSTRSAAAMGDQRWRRMLDDHDNLARQVIGKHRGKFVKSTGDGILATFDGPGRAVRCALAFSSAAKQMGLSLRAGLHTGEIEVRGEDIGGIAVHTAARVMSHCEPDEVVVSRVVTDLVAGTGLRFADRGSFELKGLTGKWELFTATS